MIKLIFAFVLEDIFTFEFVGNDTIDIPTDGGRYDVNISQRTKKSVYWDDDMPCSVRRCTWFFKRESDSRYVPYEEQFAQQIEVNIKIRCVLQGDNYQQKEQ